MTHTKKQTYDYSNTDCKITATQCKSCYNDRLYFTVTTQPIPGHSISYKALEGKAFYDLSEIEIAITKIEKESTMSKVRTIKNYNDVLFYGARIVLRKAMENAAITGGHLFYYHHSDLFICDEALQSTDSANGKPYMIEGQYPLSYCVISENGILIAVAYDEDENTRIYRVDKELGFIKVEWLLI